VLNDHLNLVNKQPRHEEDMNVKLDLALVFETYDGVNYSYVSQIYIAEETVYLLCCNV